MQSDYFHTEIQTRHLRDRAIADAIIAASAWIVERLLRLFGADPLTRARRQLEGMSDELLHDIGINRGDIPYAVEHGRDELQEQAGAMIIALPRRTPDGSGPDLPKVA